MLTTPSQTCSTCGSQLDYATLFKPGPGPCKLMEGGPCAFCLELEEFDRECQVILASLTERRRGIMQRINQRHDPFIQRLPLELASQVLVFCLPQHNFDPDPLNISLLWDDLEESCIKPFNIVLGSICQSWRRIAWSTPSLWSTLPIMLHQWHKDNRVDLTLEWLSRSTQIPLDVVVAYDPDSRAPKCTKKNVGLWKPLIDIVNGCSSRWKTFMLNVPELVHSYIVGNGEPTSILESLKVGPAYSFRHVKFSTGLSLTNALPMPSELVSSFVPLRLIDIGWSNLTTVKLSNLFLGECLVLLQWAPHLITFVINGLQGGRDETLPSPAPTTHNTLERFEIFGLDEVKSAQELLDFLIFPSLLDLSYYSEFNSLDNVSAFLQRSGCRLTKLCIIDHDPDHFLGMTMDSGLQALENLEYHGDLEDCLYCLNKPTNRDDAPIFLPNLHKLAIWDKPRNWSGLADLFQFRPLGTLSIHLTYRIDETACVDKESALRFQDLIKKGHDITIMGLLKSENGKERDLLPWIIEFWTPTKTAV